LGWKERFMSTYSFTQLDVWKKAHSVALEIYTITERFPRNQLFSLTSQMQRAAVSVPANIAEGYGRMYPKDKARLYNIAFSSMEELKALLLIARDRRFCAPDPRLDEAILDVSRMLRRLTESTLGRS